MIKHLSIFGFLFFAVIHSSVFAQKKIDYLSKIEEHHDFSLIQSTPAVKKYGDINSVKAVFDLKKKKVYFINGKKYELHYDFCYKKLNYKRSLPAFNLKNYRDGERRFCLVNINYFKKKNIYSLEYNVSDDISFENMKLAYHYFQDHFFDTLKISLNNNDRLEWKKQFAKEEIKTVMPSDLFSAQKIQIVNEGKASGELIEINKKEDLFKIPLKDKIVLLGIDVLEMPDCKAIVTDKFQTPLSHISLLAKNRGIPVLVYPQLFKDSLFKALVGKHGCLAITSEDYNLTACEKKEEKIRERPPIKISSDLNKRELLPLHEIVLADKNVYGTKCVNLAELKRIRDRKYQVPEGGFGIPFSYYNDHIKENGIDEEIDLFLDDTSWVNNREQLDEKLKLIRKKIKEAPLDPVLLALVYNKIDTSKTGHRYRFRSSSNAEDLKGFNGAGLYTSKTGIVGGKKKTIEKAIKKVWASVWSLRAFEERQIFNIDQKSVLMGVLVHRSFPNDIMNGVAITSNLYRDYNAGFVLNQQIGEHRVVDNEQYVPEQLITYFNSRAHFFNEKNAIEYISTSELNGHMPILTSEEIYFITKEMERVKRHFYKKLKGKFYKKFALDIEYKYANNLKGEKMFYIKQVRLLSK